VLRDRLTRKAAAVPHREDRANLEQGLTVARHKFVEDEAPGLVVEGTEDIHHAPTIGKLPLAYQCRSAGMLAVGGLTCAGYGSEDLGRNQMFVWQEVTREERIDQCVQRFVRRLGPTEKMVGPSCPEQGVGQAVLMAEISNSRVTLSLTKTPPVSSATFQVTP
jgi:hypothetical protein